MANEPSGSADRDGRVNEIITAYLEAVDAGHAPDRQEWLRRYPEFAAELEAFLADYERADRMAQPLRPAAEKGTGPFCQDQPSPGARPPGASHKMAHKMDLSPFLSAAPEGGPAADARTLDSAETRSTPAGARVRYFGDYELLEEIGRGGMGVVYKARQVSLNRVVALKMILAGQLASEDDVQRFHTEAEAAAQLDHPGIVPIFEVGQHEGQHYFSMGYVEGQSLAAKVARGPLEAREAAALVRTVAEAVHYAHEKGIIHRDVKPANILLASPLSPAGRGAGGEGREIPKITDFGLAKRVEGDLSKVTAAGQVLGTPSFMPPEQAAAKRDQIGPAADVYGLGAVLYTLLTGRPPFQTARPLETLLQVMEREPLSPRQMNPAVPRDLETICLKCLEKTPSRRYASVQDLVDELGRYLAGKPIRARPIGRAKRAWRWCRRNPWQTAVMAASALLLLAAVTLWNQLWQSYVTAARAERLAGRRSESLDLLARAARMRRSAELRQEAIQTITAPGIRLLHSLPAPGVIRPAEFSPDGTTLAATGEIPDKQFVRVWEMPSGQLLEESQGDGRGRTTLWESAARPKPPTFPNPAGMNTIAVSASGRIALLHSPEKDSLELWDLEAKRGISRLPEAVLFEPASRAGGGPPSAGGAPRMTITGWSSTFSPDGTLLAAEGARGKTALVRIWDVQTGSPVATILDSFGPVWNHDGRLLATIGTNPAHQGVQGQLRAGSHLNMVVGTTVANDHVNVWEVTPATPTCFVAAPIDWLCFSGDGSELAINGSFWQVVESPAQRFLRPSARAARGHYATFCGQGQVWSADFRRERSMKFEPIKLWQLAPEYREIELPNPRYSQLGLKRRVWGTDPATGNSKPFDADLMFPCPKSLALSPDGRLLATVCEVRTSSGGGGSVGEGTCVGLWDLASQHRVAVFNASSAMEDRLFCVGFSPDGKLVAVGGFKGISIWEVASGTRLRTLQHREKIEVVNALAFSPDGKTLVSTTTRMWNAGTKQLGQVLNPGFVHVDDVQTGRALGTWEHPGDAFWPAIAPDGRLLATACDDGLVRLWELPSGRALARWQAHESAATAVAISPDGQSLASADAGGTAKLWHLPTIRRQLAALGLDW